MEEEEEYEEVEDDVSQNKAVVNNENKEPTPEKMKIKVSLMKPKMNWLNYYSQFKTKNQRV